MRASGEVLNAGVQAPSIIWPVPKESVGRKRLFVPPLWSLPPGSLPVASKLFAFHFRTGAIIEHEQPGKGGPNPVRLNAPTMEMKAWARSGLLGMVFAEGVKLPNAAVAQFITLALAFLVIFGLGISVLVILKRWRNQPAPRPPSASEQLAEFESLLARGEISPQEYERIRTSLTKQLRRELDVPDQADGADSGATAQSPASPGQKDALR